jgi:hypothetical protein
MDPNLILIIMRPTSRVSSVFNGVNDAEITDTLEPYTTAIFNGYSDTEITIEDMQ